MSGEHVWRWDDLSLDAPKADETRQTGCMSLRQKIVIGLVLLAAVAAFVAAGMAGGTDTRDILVDGNPALEGFVPRRGAEVLQQNNVELLVAPGWRARINLINDLPIPDDQQFFNESLGRATYTPGEGKVITQLKGDENCVQAEYWEASVGRSESQIIGWCFTVS